MPSVLTVKAPRRAGARRLHRRALKAAGAYGLDHYMVVRRLVDPSMASVQGGPMVSFRGMLGFDSAGLPDPVQVFRVYADGREEPVRGLSIAGIDARSLKEIVAAGADAVYTVLMPASADSNPSPLAGFPVTIAAPSVLLGEAELVPAGGNVEKPPVLDSPLATGE